ncbi:MAG: hypothetical protein Q3990_03060 [Desulfovibrionaceae bacterium]|nr:hypothetical protein [Desulfovibrionaceae bacterium]
MEKKLLRMTGVKWQGRGGHGPYIQDVLKKKTVFPAVADTSVLRHKRKNSGHAGLKEDFRPGAFSSFPKKRRLCGALDTKKIII